MAKRKTELHTCLVCGYEWFPRSNKPVQCVTCFTTLIMPKTRWETILTGLHAIANEEDFETFKRIHTYLYEAGVAGRRIKNHNRLLEHITAEFKQS